MLKLKSYLTHISFDEFLSSIRKGDITKVQRYLEQDDAQINRVNDSLSPLEIAIQYKQLQIAKLLMDKGANTLNLGIPTERYSKTLRYSKLSLDQEYVVNLLNIGIPPDTLLHFRYEESKSLVIYSVQNKMTEAVDVLIKGGTSSYVLLDTAINLLEWDMLDYIINNLGTKDITPNTSYKLFNIHIKKCIRAGFEFNIIKSLVRIGLDPQVILKFGLENKNLEIITYAIENCASLNRCEFSDINSFLNENNFRDFKLILDNLNTEQNIDLYNRVNDACIEYGIFNRKPEIIEDFIRKNYLNIDTNNEKLKNSMHCFLEVNNYNKDSIDLVLSIISPDANHEFVNVIFISFFQLNISIEDIENFFNKYQNSIDVNKPDDSGHTALMHVAMDQSTNKAIHKAKILFNNNVNLDATNFDGDTALMIALRHKNYQFAKILISLGADVRIKNHLHETAFTINADPIINSILKEQKVDDISALEQKIDELRLRKIIDSSTESDKQTEIQKSIDMSFTKIQKELRFIQEHLNGSSKFHRLTLIVNEFTNTLSIAKYNSELADNNNFQISKLRLASEISDNKLAISNISKFPDNEEKASAQSSQPIIFSNTNNSLNKNQDSEKTERSKRRFA